MKTLRVALMFAAVLSLGACATMEQYQAAGDIRAFLLSIRDTDHAAFEAHIDRPALKEQVRGRLMAWALKEDSPLGALGSVLAGPLVNMAVDQLAQPQVFLAVAEADGYSPDRPIPSAAFLAPLIKPIDSERACISTRAGGPCVLVFRNEGGVWKLIAFEGDPGMLKLRFR